MDSVRSEGCFGVNNPTHAAIYDEYLQFADRFKG